MCGLYKQPAGPERFRSYLRLLQGDSGKEMILPIAGYNPMAKPFILDKISELQDLQAEKRMAEALNDFNRHLPSGDEIISVVLNLADDLGGAWTERHAADFDSKFRINAFVARNFCAPYFWTSEDYSEQRIVQRTLAYAIRTQFWKQHPKPTILNELIEQERFVAKHLAADAPTGYDPKEISRLRELHHIYGTEDDYGLLFNFFYGDAASAALDYPRFGVGELTGFDYAAIR